LLHHDFATILDGSVHRTLKTYPPFAWLSQADVIDAQVFIKSKQKEAVGIVHRALGAGQAGFSVCG
jgi:hypothetical protein